MARFYQLFEKIYGSLKNNYDKEMKSIEEIIYRYTEPNSPENILTNNLLRAYNNPTEGYYCQPYLKALFEAIK